MRTRRDDKAGIRLLGWSMAAFMSVASSRVLALDAVATPDWRSLGLLTREDEIPRALAHQAWANRFAMADVSGVSVRRGDRRDRAALEGVRDLEFDRDGTLWIATDLGLYTWADSGRPVRRPLRGGEAANRILRIASNSTGILVGTQAGAFWSSNSKSFQALSMNGASTPATLVAIEPTPNGVGGERRIMASERMRRCWILRAGQLYEVRGFVLDAGFREVDSRKLTMPRVIQDSVAVELVVDPLENNLNFVYGDLIASRPIHVSTPGHSSEGEDHGWRIVRPILPAGASIRGLAWGPRGRVWLATDRGLLEASRLAGPYSRSSQPLGSAECMDVRSVTGSWPLALCRRGIYRLEAGSPFRSGIEAESSGSLDVDPRRRQSGDVLDPDPPLAEIRERAIRRSGLGVERYRELREGLSRRAYWPDLSLRVGTDIDRTGQRTRDQSFVSGAKRHLLDRRENRGFGFNALLQFDWELGGVVYPDDAVDLSRELRQVISLRDNVSDEINQLYFERHGIRERLLRREDLDAEEVARLRLRAAEVDAGLDAWTGGWLSRWRSERRARRATRKSRSMQSRRHRRNESHGPDDPVERKLE